MINVFYSESKQYSHLRDTSIFLYRLPFSILGFPCGSAGKESTCNVRDLGSIPGLGRSPGERKGYPLQYSGLENSMDCIVHGVAKRWTRLSDFHFLYFPSFYSSLAVYLLNKQGFILWDSLQSVVFIFFFSILHYILQLV